MICLILAVSTVALGSTLLLIKGSAGATSSSHAHSASLGRTSSTLYTGQVFGGGIADILFRPIEGKLKSASSDRHITIGFIGDSITAGSGVPLHQNAVSDETIDLGTGYSAVNAGINGTTTVDWRSDNGDGYLNKALKLFQANHVQVVSIMLGTNDSKGSVSTTPAKYETNMQNIVAGVLSAGIKHVILNYPPYLVPRAPWSNNSQQLLQEYQSKLDLLIDGKAVIQGDKAAWSYFRVHPDQLKDGVHPTAEGYAALGQLWAAYPPTL